MSPKVTVTWGSSRPGGIDINLAGLCTQTFEDFEVVFVDARYHLRHSRVLEAVKASGLKQPFYHVPNHRYSDGPWGTNCAGYSTGFALADGELIVMLLDYAYCPPGWLQAHVDHAGKLVMAGAEYRAMKGAVPNDGGPRLTEFTREAVDAVPFDIAMDAIAYQRTRIDEISCFAEPFDPGKLPLYELEESDIKCTMATGEHEAYGFNTKNESFPRDAIFQVNGIDEFADLGRVPADPLLGYQLVWTGLKPWVVKEAICHCINPRRILPNMNIVIPEGGPLPPPYHSRVTVEMGNAYYNWCKEIKRLRSPNPQSLEELRDRIWIWRALSQVEDTVIPRNVVSDSEYFGKKEAA
jgi:hypothetical protein